ncbi:hypothetical protein HanIR_Chr07g0321191 [Helianthus annuus]|nr:hypothetical protein HanIR_Chr07g0321191 [Helianthus annuus]
MFLLSFGISVRVRIKSSQPGSDFVRYGSGQLRVSRVRFCVQVNTVNLGQQG